MEQGRSDDMQEPAAGGFDIAVVGLAGRFPGAGDVDAFWRNLAGAVESIHRFGDDELLAAGVPAHWLGRPDYVKAKGVLEDVESFAAEFFGFTAREASVLDPQHRLFIECAWQALEDAGRDPLRLPGVAGLYAGAGAGGYLSDRRDLWSDENGFERLLGNDKDYLTTRTAYKLNLNGPCIGVQTACSTSLVAIHLACQGLLNFECDLALAGGVSVNVPVKHGYVHQEGMIFSPDGHCRPFDAEGRGTVFGNGVGVVALRRLEDALADGDCIRAVIKGSAVNNDGMRKVGFTAPSPDGQARVVAAALSLACVDPATIGMVEAHGTATPLGDPIEIEALNRVFGGCAPGSCAIGSVKSNVGHLEVAAGVAGFIKAVLQLQHRRLAPSLHYSSPNPRIDFAGGPFYVNTRLREWENRGHPRRAGVSSFGIGGTNAHVVLEEAPGAEADAANRETQLLVLSAKTPGALQANARRLAQWLQAHPQASLADVAWTLQTGRSAFAHRLALTCRSVGEAVEGLNAGPLPGHCTETLPVAFLFPGQGAQYPGMGQALYRSEPVFKSVVDDCARLLGGHLEFDLRGLLFSQDDGAGDRLRDTAAAQPALFVVEYALAKLLQSWGIQPAALAGHSIGEWVAACVAGVFTLEDALELVAARGRLMQSLPAGGMLAVGLGEAALRAQLPPGLEIAARNAPEMRVVSGPLDAIAAFERDLDARSVSCRRLRTSHAFHSAMMDPVLEDFASLVRRKPRQPPGTAFVSNVTGTWITDEQATDPAYWARQLRQCVDFEGGLRTLLADGRTVLLEVGPGAALGALAQQGALPPAAGRVLATLPGHADLESETDALLGGLGRLWLAGSAPDWQALHGAARRRKLPLPTYAFERRRYWIDDPAVAPSRAEGGRTGHPLLGHALRMAAGTWFAGELSRTGPWYLDEHRLFGAPVFPGAAFVEWMLAALAEAEPGTGAPRIVEDIEFRAALHLPEDGLVATQTLVEQRDGGLRVRCFAKPVGGGSDAWTEHASARAVAGRVDAPPPIEPELALAGMAERPAGSLYDELRAHGIAYGPAFRSVKRLWRGEDVGWARIEVPEAAPEVGRYGLHPVVLDACLHCIGGLLDGGLREPELPVRVDRLVVHRRLGARAWCKVSSARGFGPGGDSSVDLAIFTDDGECAAQLQGLRFQAVAAAQGDAAKRPPLQAYRIEWQLAEDSEGAPAVPRETGPWLLLCPEAGECGPWAQALRSLGHVVVAVQQGEGFGCLGGHGFTVDFHRDESVERLFAVLRAEHPAWGCVLLHGAGAAAPPRGGLSKLAGALFARKPAFDEAAVPDELYATVRLAFMGLRQFFVSYADTRADIVLLTRGAPGPGPDAEPTGTAGLRAAALGGLAKAVLSEFPDVRCVQLDLDEGMGADEAGTALGRLAALQGSGRLALRGGDCFEARLVPAALPDRDVEVRADAAYLVTGGWGGLGLAVAGWLAGRGARTLVLAGRTPPTESPAIERLRERGVRVEAVAADVADEAAVAALFARMGRDLPPLKGVVHAAGSVDDDRLTQLDWPRFAGVLDAKARGAWNLHRHAGADLDFCVFFSSCASLIGSAGQANYVVANSVVDALAQHRRLLGLPGLSIGWGPWADTGLAARQGALARSRRLGLDGIGTAEGTALLGRLIAAGDALPAQVGALRADWPRLALLGQGRAPDRMLAGLAAADAEPTPDMSQLADMAPAAAQALVLDGLLRHAGSSLGLDAGQQQALRPAFAGRRLNELGLDSLMAIQVRQRVARQFGVQLALQQLMGQATAGEIAEAIYQHTLLRRMGQGGPAAGGDTQSELL